MKIKVGKVVKIALIFGIGLSLSLVSTISSVNANGPELAIMNEGIPEELVYTTDDGTYTFESVEDKESFMATEAQKKLGISTFSDVQTTSKQTGYKDVKNGWINFLTSAWSYNKSFSYSAGQEYEATFNGTFKNIGFTIRAYYTFSVGGTIKADAKRLNRLGMWQSYTVTSYHAVTTGGYGSYIINSYDYTHTSKYGTPIVNPAYQTAPNKYGEPW